MNLPHFASILYTYRCNQQQLVKLAYSSKKNTILYFALSRTTESNPLLQQFKGKSINIKKLPDYRSSSNTLLSDTATLQPSDTSVANAVLMPVLHHRHRTDAPQSSRPDRDIPRRVVIPERKEMNIKKKLSYRSEDGRGGGN